MPDNTPTTVREPARDTAIIDTFDVLVAGGGPAGIAAALAAAREGARTMLVERYSYLGGMITGANVVAILGVGDGHTMTAGGVTAEIKERLGAMDAISMCHDGIDWRVDNETFQWQAVEMLLEAGVELLFETQVVAPVVEDGAVKGVFVENKNGRQAILAEVTIDCTADADLADRAGCPCVNETHEVTLVLRHEGVDQEALARFAQEQPADYQRAMDEAKRLNGDTEVNAPRYLKHCDITDAASLTRAEIQLRREAHLTLAYLRANVPGYERATLRTYPQFGVRQGRRIVGEYMVTDADLAASVHHVDGIARMGAYFPDWGPIYQIKGLHYDIPYRCMVPQGADGLLVAGRCVSGDYYASNTLRLIAPCFATGQAAGAAAALCTELDVAPRAVPYDTLRQALKGQGVYLG